MPWHRGAALLLLLWCALPAQAERPNILLLLADDMGYNDLARHSGNGMPTPRLDRLAAEGLHFTRFYADATCAPARVALLSGRYPQRAGFRPVGRGMPPEWTTLPKALQALGYRTHHVGKWHAGHDNRAAWPRAQGFDTSFGFLNQWLMQAPVVVGEFALGAPTYEDPWLMDSQEQSRQYPGHLEDLLAARTVELIGSAEPDQPWFIYHAFFAPHTPIQPHARYRSRHPDTADGRYRALVEQLDETTGRILDALAASGQADNTVVIFASDNGSPRASSNAPFPGVKGDFLEGGVRTFMLMRWPGRLRAQTRTDISSIMDIYPTLLTLLGEPLPAALDGVPLLDMRGAAQTAVRTLFWESGISRYALLDASQDGRFMAGLWPQLYAADGIAREPFWRMLRAWPRFAARYRQWRSDVRRPDTQFEAEGSDGHGRLHGDRFQRTPGVGSFSLGVGIRPDPAANGWQVVAEQPGVLRLAYHPQRGLQAEVNGLALAAPVPAGAGCLALVLSGQWFLPSVLWGGEPDSELRLFVNGREEAISRGAIRYVEEAVLAEPTYIGRQADGSARFRGRLGMPVVINDVLLAGIGPGGSDLKEFSARLCQD